MNDRYAQNPILVFVESYVLEVIGHLSPEKHAAMQRLSEQAWEEPDPWMERLRTVLNWSDDIDDTIRSNWEGYQNAAREQGVRGSAQVFGMVFGDAIVKACV